MNTLRRLPWPSCGYRPVDPRPGPRAKDADGCRSGNVVLQASGQGIARFSFAASRSSTMPVIIVIVVVVALLYSPAAR
jgi:hypothetical protein